ncbi:hypothetical protein IW152_004776 [Coemansia sp. BCRC 34962]|nr:hypothetical protein IW152_004776 [Coemansia sp. BCRC 34962]
MSKLPQQQQHQHQQQLQQPQQLHNTRNILPNVEPNCQRDDFLYKQSLERKREKNKIAARIKRTRKKQRLETLELREQELIQRRRLLENELRISRLASSSLHRSSSFSCNAEDITGAPLDNAAGIEARAETLQSLCHDMRIVCVQAQGAIDTLTDMQRELSSLLSELE